MFQTFCSYYSINDLVRACYVLIFIISCNFEWIRIAFFHIHPSTNLFKCFKRIRIENQIDENVIFLQQQQQILHKILQISIKFNVKLIIMTKKRKCVTVASFFLIRFICNHTYSFFVCHFDEKSFSFNHINLVVKCIKWSVIMLFSFTTIFVA